MLSAKNVFNTSVNLVLFLIIATLPFLATTTVMNLSPYSKDEASPIKGEVVLGKTNILKLTFDEKSSSEAFEGKKVESIDKDIVAFFSTIKPREEGAYNLVNFKLVKESYPFEAKIWVSNENLSKNTSISLIINKEKHVIYDKGEVIPLEKNIIKDTHFDLLVENDVTVKFAEELILYVSAQ